MQAYSLGEGKQGFEIRIGIHTGPVVAGIVGVKKFAYDIWGDTVNIASRMESSGEAGRVNISGSTYELVKDKFRCEPRGKIEAKNMGGIAMYFINDEPSISI
jgi:class 3 adenylate cyclase